MTKTSSSIPTANVEVLPPLGGAGKTRDEKFGTSQAAQNVARWLDDLIVIPGTNFKIGLDPVIGLIPGVGDFLASSMGVVVLLEGVRTGAPLSVLMRMGVNILINSAVGAIPGVGDVFSAFWKSNRRNLKLLEKWQNGNQAGVRRGSRIFLTVFFLFWLAIFATSLWVSVQILQFIFGGF